MTPHERQMRRAHRAGATDRLIELSEPTCELVTRRYWLPGAGRDDLLQEARIAVVIACESWRPDGGRLLGSFVELVVRRRVQTAVTGALRRQHQVLSDARRFEEPVGHGDDEDMLLGDVLPSPSADPEVLAGPRADLAAVLAAVPTLTPIERVSVVGLFRGDSYAAIAAATGTTTKSIDNAAQRARRKLRQEVAAA